MVQYLTSRGRRLQSQFGSGMLRGVLHAAAALMLVSFEVFAITPLLHSIEEESLA